MARIVHHIAEAIQGRAFTIADTIALMSIAEAVEAGGLAGLKRMHPSPPDELVGTFHELVSDRGLQIPEPLERAVMLGAADERGSAWTTLSQNEQLLSQQQSSLDNQAVMHWRHVTDGHESADKPVRDMEWGEITLSTAPHDDQLTPLLRGGLSGPGDLPAPPPLKGGDLSGAALETAVARAKKLITSINAKGKKGDTARVDIIKLSVSDGVTLLRKVSELLRADVAKRQAGGLTAGYGWPIANSLAGIDACIKGVIRVRSEVESLSPERDRAVGTCDYETVQRLLGKQLAAFGHIGVTFVRAQRDYNALTPPFGARKPYRVHLDRAFKSALEGLAAEALSFGQFLSGLVTTLTTSPLIDGASIVAALNKLAAIYIASDEYLRTAAVRALGRNRTKTRLSVYEGKPSALVGPSDIFFKPLFLIRRAAAAGMGDVLAKKKAVLDKYFLDLDVAWDKEIKAIADDRTKLFLLRGRLHKMASAPIYTVERVADKLKVGGNTYRGIIATAIAKINAALGG